ncbi:CDP-archaeol synthase [Aquisalimonas asiatica]|nr:CDP-archaeol synthase [Aquisalimonas asiatica]
MIATLQVLIIITVANAAPVVLSYVLGRRSGRPVDGGSRWRDGRRVFGPSKTVRGVIAAVIATTGVTALLGLPLLVGAAAGALAMAGDLASSFAKRRMGLMPSSRFIGLDQVPEAFLPLLVLIPLPMISTTSGVAAAALFVLLGPPASWMLYRAGIRREPH